MTLSRSSGTSSPRNVGVTPVTHVFGPPNRTLVLVSLPPTSLTAGRPRTADVIIPYLSRFTLPRNPPHLLIPTWTPFLARRTGVSHYRRPSVQPFVRSIDPRSSHRSSVHRPSYIVRHCLPPRRIPRPAENPAAVGGMTERPAPWRTTTPGRIVDAPPESIGPALNSLLWVCPPPGRVVQLIPAPFALCLACLLRQLWQWWRRWTASLVLVPWF